MKEGDLSLMPQREVIVKSHLRQLGTCVVAVPEGATPLTVFSQVSAYLRQDHRIPPLARWLYVGEDRKSGVALDLEAALIDQVLDNEQLTVECLEQGFGLSQVKESGTIESRGHRDAIVKAQEFDCSFFRYWANS